MSGSALLEADSQWLGIYRWALLRWPAVDAHQGVALGIHTTEMVVIRETCLATSTDGKTTSHWKSAALH